MTVDQLFFLLKQNYIHIQQLNDYINLLKEELANKGIIEDIKEFDTKFQLLIQKIYTIDSKIFLTEYNLDENLKTVKENENENIKL